MATHYRRRQREVIKKWYRCWLTKEPISTLRVESIVTYYRPRHLEVIKKWYRC